MDIQQATELLRKLAGGNHCGIEFYTDDHFMGPIAVRIFQDTPPFSRVGSGASLDAAMINLQRNLEQNEPLAV